MVSRGSAGTFVLVALCLAACSDGTTATGGSAGMAGSASGSPATAGSPSGGNQSGGSQAVGGQSSGAPSGGTQSAGDSGAGGSAPTGGGASGGQGGTSGAAGASTGGSGGSAGMGGMGGGLPKRVLLYHFSTLSIPSVPAQLTLLKTQLETWGYMVEDSVKPADVSTENLARFAAVGMINTCFEPFGAGQKGDTQTAALKAFVENGGGLFGTHCASVTFQSADPPHPYNDLIGGRGGHGSFDGKSACRTTAEHPTSQLPATFDFNGNLDNADYVAADATVLVKCKWSGGDMKDTAVSWVRTAGKGRVFYSNFAKVDADLSDATLGQKHLILGLGWVLGR